MNNKIKTLLCFDFILYHINTFSVAMTQKCRNCENIICASVNTRGSRSFKLAEKRRIPVRRSRSFCANTKPVKAAPLISGGLGFCTAALKLKHKPTRLQQQLLKAIHSLSTQRLLRARAQAVPPLQVHWTRAVTSAVKQRPLSPDVRLQKQNDKRC